jgi:hypothetical protein
MVRKPQTWQDADLSGQPVLVIGDRPRPRQLEAWVVDTRETAHGILRGVAERAIDDLTGRTPVTWQPEGGFEAEEEYLVLETDDLLEVVSSASAPVELAEASSLLNLLVNVSALEDLDGDRIRAGRFLFYAITFEQGDAGDPISFVRAWDPTAPLRAASSWFRWQGALEPAPPPDLGISDNVDLVMTSTEIAILRPSAFDRLFADIRMLLNDVPTMVKQLGRAMTGLKMTSAARKALQDVCATRPSYARRLRLLATSGYAAAITPAELRRVLRAHGETASDYLTNNRLDIGPDHVASLLDVAEGRWYTADFSKERRRADRYRTR